jgi:hypothetical protein
MVNAIIYRALNSPVFFQEVATTARALLTGRWAIHAAYFGCACGGSGCPGVNEGSTLMYIHP